MIVLILALQAVFLALIAAQLRSSEGLSGSVAKDIQNRAINAATTSLSSRSVRQAYYALEILEYFKIFDKTKHCACANYTISGNDGYDVFYQYQLSRKCQCDILTPPSVIDSLTAAIANRRDVASFAGSALALKSLSKNAPTFDQVLEFLKPLSQSTGYFKASASDESKGNIDNAALALQLLAAYSDDSSKASLKDIAERSLKLLPTGDDETAVDPTLFGYISKISDKKPRVSSNRLAVLADLLLDQLLSTNLAAVFSALDSLKATSLYKTAPVAISVDKSTFGLSESKKLRVTVKDVYGKAVEVNSIELKSLKLVGNDGILHRTGITGGDLDLSSLSLSPGRYVLELAVSLPDRTQEIVVKRYIVVTTSLSISDVAAAVTDSKTASTADLTPVSRQNSLSDVSGSALDGDVFHISFVLKAPSGVKLVKPHQVFVRFSHQDSGTDTYFLAKAARAATSDAAVYRAVVSLLEEVETFLYLSGEYTVYILAADVVYDAPVEFIVGSVKLLFAPKPKTEFPLYAKSLLDTSDNTLVPLNEIEHVMRPPAKRASFIAATVFTSLIVVATLVLLAVIVGETPNVSRLANPASILFIVLIGATLLIYLGYWFSLQGFSFYDTIKYMCFLFPVTFVVGRFALAHITEERMKESKKN